MLGQDGDDIVFGEAGDDTMTGGGGNDILIGGSGDDVIHGFSKPVFEFVAGVGTYIDFSPDGLDLIFGGDGNDVIYGNGGDVIYGGAGNDWIIIQKGAASTGFTAFGDQGDDVVVTDSGIDFVYGDDWADLETGNDTIWTGADSDWVFAGAGSDLIGGGTASDFVFGGAGADYYNVSAEMNAGDIDYFLDLALGTDYFLLPTLYLASILYTDGAGFAFGTVIAGAGNGYIFAAQDLTAVQLQASVLFV